MTKSLLACAAAAALVAGCASSESSSGSAGGASGVSGPTYGSVNLSAGFTPDPYSVPIIAGGTMSASEEVDGCDGWVAHNADFMIDYAAGGYPLVISASSGADVTLVVAGPKGGLWCNDDGGGGTDARVVISQPVSGLYGVWVGVYDKGARPQATLSISERVGKF